MVHASVGSHTAGRNDRMRNEQSQNYSGLMLRSKLLNRYGASGADSVYSFVWAI